MYNCEIIKNGNTFTVKIPVNNISNVDADNVVVTITHPGSLEVIGSNTNNIGSVNVVSTTETTWTISTIFGQQELIGSFSFSITDTSTTPWDISWNITTDTPESNIENNSSTVRVDPLTDYKIQELVSESIDGEKVFEVPTSAFANPNYPTKAELQTWVDNNLNALDKVNGTTLTYNPLRYAEFETWGDAVVNLFNTVERQVFSVFINGIKTDFNLLDNGVEYFGPYALEQATLQHIIDETPGVSGIAMFQEETETGSGDSPFTLNVLKVGVINQTGINSFGVGNFSTSASADVETTNLYSLQNNNGYKEPPYVWTLNKDLNGDSKITLVENSGVSLDEGNILNLGSDEKPYLSNYDIYKSTFLNKFISTWNVATDGGTITLPLSDNNSHDFIVEWGDGSVNHITSHDQPEITHVYATAGEYTIQISGDIGGFKFLFFDDKQLLLNISQWGSFKITETSSFYGCSNLDITANDAPTILTTDLSNTFQGCSSLTSIGGNWDVSNVTNMASMFHTATLFNGDISNWDTSNVVSMSYMFFKSSSFNQNISNWNTSNVTDVGAMFNDATSFNQNISSWNTSSVVDMSYMFYNATSFNQPIGSWDTSNVSSTAHMFNSATSFNQPIGNWDVSSVTDMITMFYNATSFNQDLSSWCVINITSEPSNFSANTTAWTLPKPVWGTCP